MANLYDLKKFDLNLLVIFECIYQHLSISRAAETLYITPSAVSQSLQRLRTQLNDPLFIRSGKGITPTTVGANLHQHLEKNLNQLEQTINIMNGSELKKSFVIYCPQIIIQGRLSGLLEHLLTEENYQVDQYDVVLAPETAEDLLAYRKADLIVTLAPINNRSVICRPYFKFPVLLVARNEHSRLNDHITYEGLVEEKFAQLRSQENGIKEYRAQTELLFPERNIAFRGDSFISILNIISTTDLIGTVPAPIFEQYKKVLNLKSITMPFELPDMDAYMLYNRSALNSHVFSHFIDKIDEE
ncbi:MULTISPECIES: DNA-binding transcriptional repressor CitR [Enterobacter]|uniref:DNA-binding transcriptional repressor CitR n=1 Tax=Enterobacter TaxID=547 RepID=UPI0012605B69|nr:LysR family transcriptional regulator [Enterobacter oligotrophicus]ELW1646652.1 LysR family transcriptional regulator [Enterobacter oligotrophicus]MBT9425698.1 LysR family transcriptional regulator [Enterobacter oligotrophicus]